MKENGKTTSVMGKVRALQLGEQCLVKRSECRPSIARTIISHVAQDYERKYETKMIEDTLVVTRTL